MISGSKTTRWTSLIDEICDGSWVNPLNGKRLPPAPYDTIIMEETLAGKEASLVSSLGFAPPFVIVSDVNTHKAFGQTIARALAAIGPVTEIVLSNPHADMANVRSLAQKLDGFSSIIAVGSGTINDLTKYASFTHGKPYCVFATAASMNGYTSSTASITLDNGLKISLPAQVPLGFFVDLSVCASAPVYLNAAGFGDCLCRSVAQIDWWMSHRLLETPYFHEPYIIEIPDEIILMERAGGIASGDIEAVGTLFRVLTLCGLGTSMTGVSNHGSMGEHQISHYIDCFAGAKHPGSLHGQQVGVATLTMARIQSMFLNVDKAPVLADTKIDIESMSVRMGSDVANACSIELGKKIFDAKTADDLNLRLEKIWPELREQCQDMAVPVDVLQSHLALAGGPTSASQLGLPVEFYRQAVCHAHEMRNRFSFADIASQTGQLQQLASAEV